MTGIIYALVAGVFVAMQTVFNARVSEQVGLWEATTIVHLVGLLFSLAMLAFLGEGQFGKWPEVNKLYLLGGAFGVIVVYGMMRGVLAIGTTLAVSILIVTQLTVAMLIDFFGWFGTPRVMIDWTKPMGIAVMVIGIIIYKLKG